MKGTGVLNTQDPMVYSFASLRISIPLQFEKKDYFTYITKLIFTLTSSVHNPSDVPCKMSNTTYSDTIHVQTPKKRLETHF